MPVITSINPQKNNRRVNIYLDGEFGFGIDLENFVTTGLKVNLNLTNEEVKKIIKKSEFQKTLDYLLKFATLRSRSEKEIRNWFRRRDVHKSLHGELFNRLKKLDLIDDRKFAVWWIDQRQSFRPKSKMVLEIELRNKGIAKEIISEVLEDVKIDEVKTAKEMLKKKSHKWKNIPKDKIKQKMSQYLAGKGFGWDVIKKAVSVEEKLDTSA